MGRVKSARRTFLDTVPGYRNGYCKPRKPPLADPSIAVPADIDRSSTRQQPATPPRLQPVRRWLPGASVWPSVVYQAASTTRSARVDRCRQGRAMESRPPPAEPGPTCVRREIPTSWMGGRQSRLWILSGRTGCVKITHPVRVGHHGNYGYWPAPV